VWKKSSVRKSSTRFTDSKRTHAHSGCKKLKGNTGFYPVRIGNFRVVYDIQDGLPVVVVVEVGDRKSVYD